MIRSQLHDPNVLVTQLDMPGEVCLVQPSTSARSHYRHHSLKHTTDTAPASDLAAKPMSLLVEDESARGPMRQHRDGNPLLLQPSGLNPVNGLPGGLLRLIRLRLTTRRHTAADGYDG